MAGYWVICVELLGIKRVICHFCHFRSVTLWLLLY